MSHAKRSCRTWPASPLARQRSEVEQACDVTVNGTDVHTSVELVRPPNEDDEGHGRTGPSSIRKGSESVVDEWRRSVFGNTKTASASTSRLAELELQHTAGAGLLASLVV